MIDLHYSQISTTIGRAGGSLSIAADIVVLDSSDILLSSEQPAFLPMVEHLVRLPDSQIILNSAPFDLGRGPGHHRDRGRGPRLLSWLRRCAERCGAQPRRRREQLHRCRAGAARRQAPTPA